MTHVAMIANASGCTVVVGTTVHTIANDHPRFEEIQEAYAAGDYDLLEGLISVRKAIESVAEGTDLQIINGSLFYGDRELTNGLARRIVGMIQSGKERVAQPLVRFMENLLENPSRRAVEGLYEWLERSNLPITTDGHFIAWKVVQDDYTDCYTGTFDNSVGAIPSVARNEVDENPDRTCSYGLHFCSNEYLPSFGAFDRGRRTMMVKVNPADVVAFPQDYNVSKGRCCRYEVISEVTKELTETEMPAVINVSSKVVKEIETRGTRAEITLVFTDGTKQLTKNRLGDTTTWEQNGATVQLLPSGREIEIVA